MENNYRRGISSKSIFIISFSVTTIVLWIGIGEYVWPFISNHVLATRLATTTTSNEQFGKVGAQTFPSMAKVCLEGSYNQLKTLECSTDTRLQPLISFLVLP